MIFKRSFHIETTWVALGLFVVLLLVIFASQLPRFLGAAAVGMLTSGVVWTIIGFAMIRYLPILFTLVLFISILWVMTRMWRDSEMVIWFSHGLSIYDFIIPVLRFAVPIVALIAILSMVLSPWSMQKSREYQENMMRRDEIMRLASGVFREAGQGNLVYFIGNSEGKHDQSINQGIHVFAQIQRDGKIITMLAQRGGLITGIDGKENEKWLWLENGRSYEGIPGTINYDVLQFHRIRIRLTAPRYIPVSLATQAMPTSKLLKCTQLECKAEVAWRLALPIAAMLLSMAAIPLAFFHLRGERVFNLIFSILLAFLYFNCINIFQAWIAMGHLSSQIGMWPLHGIFALVVWSLFWFRRKMRR